MTSSSHRYTPPPSYAAELLTAPPPEPRWKTYLKGLGLAGFLFFMVKGLAWLVVPLILAKACTGDSSP